MDTQLHIPVVSWEIDFGLPQSSRSVTGLCTTTPSIQCEHVNAFLKCIRLSTVDCSLY